MVLCSLVHPTVEFVDLFIKKLFLNWLKIAESRVVTSKELVQLVDMAHVVFLLESNVDDCLRDVLSNTVKELGLSDNDFELRCKIDCIDGLPGLFLNPLVKDEALKQGNGKISVFLVPVIEDLVFMVLIKLFG